MSATGTLERPARKHGADFPSASPSSTPARSADPAQTVFLAAAFLGSFALDLLINWRLRFAWNDDAYIHLRIVDHLVKTGHAYFNLGESVMVTSSPLWTLLLAANQLVFGSANGLWIWNALFVAVAAAAAYSLAARSFERGRWPARLLALAVPLAVVAALADSSFIGMETPLAVALLLLAALAFERSSAAALPLLTLAAFTRFEFAPLLLVASLICLALRSARRSGAVAAAAIAGIFSALLFSQYGTLVPNAVRAKGKGYGLSHLQVFTRNRPALLWIPESLVNMVLLLGVMALALYLAHLLRGRKSLLRAQWIAAALLLWGCALASLYWLAKTFVFAWYVPLVSVPILVGALLAIFAERSARRAVLLVAAVPILAFFPVCENFADLLHDSITGRTAPLAMVSQASRAHTYLAVGGVLARQCPASDLMSSEIGALGYAFPGHVLDGFGIASPDAIKYHPMPVPQQRADPTIGAIPPGFVQEKRPDLIVTFDLFGAAILRSAYVRANYDDLRFAPVLPRDAAAGVKAPWGIRTLHVLIRKDGGCAASSVEPGLSAVLTKQ